MNRKATVIAYRSVTVLLLACISTFAFVFTRSSASEQVADISAPNQETVTKAKKTTASENSESVVLKAEKRGFPLINLRDGKRLETDFLAADGTAAAASTSFAAAKPVVLTNADLTNDGAQDLIVGYKSGDGGYLAFYQGSLDTLSATTPEVFEGFQQGRFPDPFLSEAKLIKLPAAPDFVATGDFNRDGSKDIIAAQKGDRKAFLLLGNGGGKFKTTYVEFPGTVTALLSEMIDPFDNQTDLAVAVTTENEGAALLVYAGAADAFADSPMTYRLPAPATALAIGQLDNDDPMDILAAAGGKLVVVHGSYSKNNESLSGAQTEVLDQGFGAAAIRVGNFVWDRENRAEIGVLDESGAIRILERGKLNKRIFGKADRKAQWQRQREESAQAAIRKSNYQPRRSAQQRTAEKWTESDRIQIGAPLNAAAASPASFFASARMTPFGVEDLLVLDPASRKLHILVWNNDELKKTNDSLALSSSGNRAVVTLDVEGATPVAALPMRLSVMNRPGIVLLDQNSSEPSFALAAPAATFNVNTPADTYDGSCTTAALGCSFRDALDDANETAAADMIVLPSDTYTINPALGGPDDDVNVDPLDQTAGDWDVYFDTTITGAGQATTILQAAAAPALGHDRILDALQSGTGTPDLTISGVTLQNGRCRADVPCVDGGALRYAVDALGVLTISNSTIKNNRTEVNTANPANNGGGVFGGAADYVFTNVTFSNNIAGFATGGCTNCGGEGGAAIIAGTSSSNPTSLTMSGSSLTGNQARTTTNFGGRGGALATSPNSVSITGGTFENNTADLDGGALRLFTATTIDNATINGNSAKQNGGGIFSDPFDGTTLTSTFTNLTLKGNTADSNAAIGSNEATRGAGGAIYHERGTLNVNNSTIGGTGAGEGNTAFDGGGVARGYAPVQNLGTALLSPPTSMLNIDGGSITGNLANHNGGGAFVESGARIFLSASILNIGATAPVTISNNQAMNHGGGISNEGMVGVIKDATIANNTAAGNGGGIYNIGTLGAITTPALNNNTAANGGGIFTSSGALSIENGTISNNVATGGKGGGIEHSGNSASLVKQVVINNNTGSGIYITGAGSLDAESNTITGNSGDGITKIGTGTGSHFNSNTIHSNTEIGIDLSDNGVTPNDANDTDTGPNNLQNFPVLNSVRRTDGVANVTLNAANGKYRVQYYANTTCDASGHGEGELFLTSQDVEITTGNTMTFSSPVLNYGTREQITAVATHDANGNGNFDDDGSSSEFSACRKVNTAPTITAQAITRQQGSPASNSSIAVVADPDQPLNTLPVTVNGGASATINGVTVSNIAVSNSGNVTADVTADCTATTASFTLRVTDNVSDFNEATLNVTVNPNTSPTLGNYSNTTVNAGSSGTVVTPDAAPADNGSIQSITAAASAGFTGTFSVNTSTGAVTINNAAPAGVYTVTVSATDNCGATATKQFQLTVNAVPTITAEANVSRQQGSPSANSQIAAVNDADQTEETLTVTVNGSASATVNGVTISNIAVSAAGVVTADVVAACGATNAGFTLRATDSTGAFSEAALNVAVTANTAPTVGNYPNASLQPGGGTTVSPSAAPTDNGSIASATATAPGFGGTLTVNPTNGDVSISSANPYGSYTVTVAFTDNCGATTNKQFTLNVLDETPPDTTITGSPTNPSNSSNATFSFTGTDTTDGSGIASFECDLDGGGFTTCADPKTYIGLADGSHTFQVRAIDAAGNRDPSPATYTWTIDTIPPSVTINQAAGQSDPAVGSGSVIHFTAVFSEPVTGFTNSDVTLSGTAGATTVVVTEIAPNNGTTYDVAVSGMTQAGTVIVSIPAGAAQDAATNGNTASTSTDNTVTYTPNRPPVASPDSYSTNEDTPLVVPAPGVLGNDSDPDPGNTITAVLVSSPANAQSFALNADGSFNYTPTANFNGSTSFSYKARDNSNADSSVVSVTINVVAVNDAPSFNSGGNVTVAEDSGAYSASWATAISKGPANESAQTAAFTVTNNSNPALFSSAPAVAPNGTLSFTPAPNAFGSAIITVVLTDNGGTANGGVDTSAPVSFTINVTPVNDPPTVAVVAGGSCGGSNGTLNLLISDVDSPAGSFTVSGSSSNTAVVANSGIVFGGSGSNRTVTITAVLRNSIQTSVVTVTVNDGQGGTATTTINVIAGSNKPETINGTGGSDLIFGGNGEDTINAGAGNDMVCGGNGNDTIFGGTGDDTLNGENGDDVIQGEDGNDALIGENGNDTLTGGADADFFSGGSGSDNLTDFTPAQGDTSDNSLALLDGVSEATENRAAE